jgi:hypothetical protein
MAIALSVAFTPTPLAAGEKIVIQATAQKSAGRSFASRGEYKNVFIGAAASASPSNILTAYNAIFGVLISGQKIFFRAFTVSSNGIASTPILSSVIVA